MNDLHQYLHEMKVIQVSIINYIEDDNYSENSFEDLVKIIDDQEIQKDYQKLKLILYLISNISSNHFRSASFFEKIGKILCFLKQFIQENFDNSSIFNFFKANKRILLILFEENIISIDDYILSEIDKLDSDKSEKENHFYFYKEIQNFSKETFLIKVDEFYDENRKIGENDNYICNLIRKDLIDEFVIHVNKTNIRLSSQINSSLFETNQFLIDKNPTLIEYAAFFGSIQIFQFLQLNNVELSPSLWLYAIHGKNPEIIHLLENIQVKPSDESFRECLFFSIKCHHNEIANYIIDNLLVSKEEDKENSNDLILSKCLEFYNFSIIPKEFDEKVFLYYLCKYNYYTLVDILLKNPEFDINAIIIEIKIYNSISFNLLMIIFMNFYFIMKLLIFFL